SVWFLLGREQPFDANLWTDPIRVEKGIRLRMADSLIARGTLQGKTRDEVVALLGAPRDGDYFSDWDLVYWLGPERGFISIDSEWLVIKFDREDRGADVQIITD